MLEIFCFKHPVIPISSECHPSERGEFWGSFDMLNIFIITLRSYKLRRAGSRGIIFSLKCSEVANFGELGQQAHRFCKMRGEILNWKASDIYKQKAFQFRLFYLNLLHWKSILLTAVWIELSVKSSPHFANTFSVMCNATQTNRNHDIQYLLH